MKNGYNFKKWGTGSKAIVFLHDFGGAGLCWQWVARQLASEYVCYAPDLPGFGSSPAVDNPTLESLASVTLDLVEEVNERHMAPVIVAHGFSVSLTLKILDLKDPGWKQLIFINPSLPIGANFSATESECMADHPSRQAAIATVQRSISQPLRPDRFSLAVESQLMADSATWHWWLDEGSREKVDATVMDCSLTILSSARDPRVDLIATRREIASRLPTAVVREHPTAGHLLPLEEDTWVAQQIRGAMPTQTRSRSYAVGL